MTIRRELGGWGISNHPGRPRAGLLSPVTITLRRFLFIGKTHTLGERGIDVTREAKAVIDAMPDTFKDWIAIPPGRCFKAPDIAIPDVAAA